MFQLIYQMTAASKDNYIILMEQWLQSPQRWNDIFMTEVYIYKRTETSSRLFNGLSP